jgi:hypothetical protein
MLMAGPAVWDGGTESGPEPTVLKQRDENGNHGPRSRLVTDDGLRVPAYERRGRHVAPGQTGCAERAAGRSPADRRRR